MAGALKHVCMITHKSYGNLCSLFYDATKKYASLEEVTFYAQFMQKNNRVLEAMCGSGRLLIPLMQAGFLVDGVDNSQEMLARCRARCAQSGLMPQLYEQSLETFKSPHKYATITIAVGSFQLITDHAMALNALKNLHAHMVDDGNLLIDTFVPDTENMHSLKAVRLSNTTVLTLATEYTYNEKEKRADAWCTYELFVDGNLEKEEKELIQVTWYSDQEFKDLLHEAGFEYVNTYKETFPITGPSRIVHAIKRTI